MRVTRSATRKLCEHCERQIEPGEPQVVLTDLRGRLTAMHPTCRLKYLEAIRGRQADNTAE